MLQVKNLSKQYNKINAINDISFTINDNSVVGIVGPNGAGKSTLLSILATIIKPSYGEVFFNGLDIVKCPELARRHISFVPQHIALYEDLTVKDNFKFWSGQKKIFSKSLTQEAQESIELLDLNIHLNKKVKHLSGGLKRRLNIAVALLNNPDVIIMDEPTAGVDIKTRNEITNFICSLSKNKTILYTSHHSDEIEYISDRVFVLNNGSLIYQGTVEEISNRTANKRFNDGISDIIGWKAIREDSKYEKKYT